MTGNVTEAARLPQAGRDQAALTDDAEGQAPVALLGPISGNDWQRPTDCPEWDVRAMVSQHLVAQCEDGPAPAHQPAPGDGGAAATRARPA